MAKAATLLAGLGGEAGCLRLSKAFYARVGRDPVLRPLFPGKSLRCATEEFAAFLIQFLGGDEDRAQFRWWLSLRESHARFQISADQRRAWLGNMRAALDEAVPDESARTALCQFFEHGSAYVAGAKEDAPPSKHAELSARWDEQRVLDNTMAAIAAGRDAEAIALAPRFQQRPSVFVGVLARMVQSGRADLIAFVLDAIGHDSMLSTRRFGGRALLHYAAGAGSIEVIAALLNTGIDPDLQDTGGHTALYRAANECGSEAGPEIVRVLVQAGADVNACGGVTKATPLHMAARRGFVEIAKTLLDLGAAIDARDTKRDTPLQRAINCRKSAVAELLQAKTTRTSSKQPAVRR